MGHRVRLSQRSVDEMANAWAALANNGTLSIYSGPRPETTDVAADRDPLVSLTFGTFDRAVNGTVRTGRFAPAETRNTGDASWYRVFTIDRTVLSDGEVGLKGSGSDLELAGTLRITAGLPFIVSGFSYTVLK